MERRTLKTKSGDVLLEFIDGHWIVYPIQPTYWRKDPQALRMMAQESNTNPSEIDQSKLTFESFHIIDLSKGFGKGTFDLGRNRDREKGEEPHRGEGPSTSDASLGPFGFSESDLYPFTDRRWSWLKKMIDDGLVENPNPGSWPTDRKSSKIWEAYYRFLEEMDFDQDSSEEDLDQEDEGWTPHAQGIDHSAVIKEPTRLFDLLFRWSDSGHRLVFKGNDESGEIKRFITEVLGEVGESESLISSLDSLCNPRPVRILLPGLVEWPEMLISWWWCDSWENLEGNNGSGGAYWGYSDSELSKEETVNVLIIPDPILLSETILEWHPESGFRLIVRRARSRWGWASKDLGDEDYMIPVTVKVSVDESTFSEGIEKGEELCCQLQKLIENLGGEWSSQEKFTDNEYCTIAGTDPHYFSEEDEDEFAEDEFDEEEFDDEELDDEDEYEHDADEDDQTQQSLTSSRYRWSDVSAFLKTAFPEVYEDFKRALEKSNVS